MHVAPRRIAVALIAGTTLWLTACGDPDTRPAADDAGTIPATTDLAAPATETAPTTAPELVASTMAAAQIAECPAERTAMEVATEAFDAQFGRFPGSERELVENGFLREATGVYSVDVDTGEITRRPGLPCPEGGASAPTTSEAVTAESMTVEGILAEMGDDGVAMMGGPECAEEFARIAVAGEQFIAREGRDPESLDELADDLDPEPVLWAWDADAEILAPADGSPCPDIFRSEGAAPCETRRRTLEVAVEAYTAQNGRPPASEADLVPELLREEIEQFDLDADGAVVPVPGGPCDQPAPPVATVP